MATPESERAYLERLGTLLELEAAEEAARAKARAERLSPADAEAAGISLVDLVVADEYSGLGGLQVVKLVKRNRTLDLPWSRIDTGSPVVLTTLDLSLRGVVASRKRDQLSVALQGGFHDLPEDAAFRLDLQYHGIGRALADDHQPCAGNAFRGLEVHGHCVPVERRDGAVVDPGFRSF